MLVIKKIKINKTTNLKTRQINYQPTVRFKLKGNSESKKKIVNENKKEKIQPVQK